MQTHWQQLAIPVRLGIWGCGPLGQLPWFELTCAWHGAPLFLINFSYHFSGRGNLIFPQALENPRCRTFEIRDNLLLRLRYRIILIGWKPGDGHP